MRYHLHTLVNFPDGKEQSWHHAKPLWRDQLREDISGTLIEYDNASSIVFTIVPEDVTKKRQQPSPS